MLKDLIVLDWDGRPTFASFFSLFFYLFFIFMLPICFIFVFFFFFFELFPCYAKKKIFEHMVFELRVYT